MKLPKFEYKKAEDLKEALAFYSYYNGRSLFLAGGTDIIPRLKLRLQRPVALIDLKGVKDLQGIKRKDGYVRIGSLVTLYELKQFKLIKKCFPALWEALDGTSCETLQMRGTLGGNLIQDTRCLFYNQSQLWRDAGDYCLKMGGKKCNVVGGQTCFSNYCSDTAPALLSLQAQVGLIGPQGERRIPLYELYTGNGEKPFNLLTGEIMIELLIPEGITKGAYEKLRVRRSIDYPLLGAAFSVVQEKGRLSIGAVGPKPFFFNMDELSERAIAQTAQIASDNARPVMNAVLSPLYRKRMVKVIALKLMRKWYTGGRDGGG